MERLYPLRAVNVERLGRILALAGLWMIGGFMIGAALEMIGFDTYPLRTILAAVNLILGMIIFKGAARYRVIDQAFLKMLNRMKWPIL